MFREFFTKQSPILGLLGMGGGIARGGGVIPFEATGGTKTTHGIYTIHVFDGPGTFTVSKSEKNCDILLVAGGGGGTLEGGGGGGAGGAGGLIFIPASHPDSLLTPGTYSITVGGGGNGGHYQPNPGFLGTGGGNTTLTTSNPLGPLTALGGSYGDDSGGGSGGGASSSTTQPGVQTTSPQIPAKSRTHGFGNPGAGGVGPEPQGYRAGGGGGAATAGLHGNQGGQGGDGKPAPSMSASFAPLDPHGAYSKGGRGGTRGGHGGNATGYGGGGGGGSDEPIIKGRDGTPGSAAIAYET